MRTKGSSACQSILPLLTWEVVPLCIPLPTLVWASYHLGPGQGHSPLPTHLSAALWPFLPSQAPPLLRTPSWDVNRLSAPGPPGPAGPAPPSPPASAGVPSLTPSSFPPWPLQLGILQPGLLFASLFTHLAPTQPQRGMEITVPSSRRLAGLPPHPAPIHQSRAVHRSHSYRTWGDVQTTEQPPGQGTTNQKACWLQAPAGTHTGRLSPFVTGHGEAWVVGPR